MAEYPENSAAQQNNIMQKMLYQQQQQKQYMAVMHHHQEQQQRMANSLTQQPNILRQQHNINVNSTTSQPNTNLMGGTVAASAATAIMHQKNAQSLMQQQSQQQVSFQVPQTPSPMQQQTLIQQQRNSPHILQQQSRQMGMSPQMIQRATPSPAIVVTTNPTQQRTPPNQQHHIVIQQQPSPYGTNTKPTQYIQFARPSPQMYQQQQHSQQQSNLQTQPHLMVTVHSQQQPQHVQQQYQQSSHSSQPMYRQIVSSQNQSQSSNPQQQAVRYAYIQTNDGTMNVPVQQQNISENRSSQIVTQQTQPMQIWYNSPHRSQQQQLQHAQPQITLRQALTDSNLMRNTQQKVQYHHQTQQQPVVQQVVVNSSQSQLQRNVILLPSTQPTTVIGANSLPLTQNGNTSASAIFITSNSGNLQPQSFVSKQVINNDTENVLTASNVQNNPNVIDSSQSNYQESNISVVQTTMQSGDISDGTAQSIVVSPQNQYLTSTTSAKTNLNRNNLTMPVVSSSPNLSTIVAKSRSPSKINQNKNVNAGNVIRNTTTMLSKPLSIPNEINVIAPSSTEYNFVNVNSAMQLLERLDLDKLLKSIDEYSAFEDEAAIAILQLTDQFVDEIIDGTIKLSKYRNSKKVGTNDVRYFLKSRYNMVLLPDPKNAGLKIGGNGSNSLVEISAAKRRKLAVHEQRMALIEKTLKK